MAAIIFDLDDTLYKERLFVASAYRAVAAYMAGITGADPIALARIIAEHRPKGFEAAIQAQSGLPGVGRIHIDDLVYIYRSHIPDITLDSEVADTLHALRNRGHRLGIITDGTVLTQSSKIRALGLNTLISPDDIWISESTGGDKTTTLPWEAAEARFHNERLRVYVGDNLSKDFRLPNTRGWHTVMLRDPHGVNVFPQRPCEWPHEYRPHTTVDTISALLSLA
ncbi:MAG: HAD family hydrolase [Muribaculaceae bacterium]|nr:HAD family hydrolase [Muribaculaceae bacterium]